MSAPGFSNTQMSTYTMCGERFRRRYIEKDHEPANSGLIRGSAVARAAHHDLKWKCDTGQLADRAEVIAMARDHVADRFQNQEVELDETEALLGKAKVRDETVDDAVTAIGLYHDEVAVKIDPWMVEPRIVVHLPNVGRNLVMYPDVVEKDYTIRDLKTSKKTPGDDAAEQSEQLPMYAMGLRFSSGHVSPRQVLDYVVLIKKPKTIHREAHHDRNDHARTLLRVEQAVRGIDAGIFLPAQAGSWWCSRKWCSYYGTCPYVKGGAVVVVPGVNDAVPDREF